MKRLHKLTSSIRQDKNLTASSRQRSALPTSVFFLALIILVLQSSIMCALPAPPQDSGKVYYVSPSGSDSDPGTESQPWRTIHKAAEVVEAGDTVIIKDGVYSDGIEITKIGTEAEPIVFRAEGRGAIIEGSGDKRDAFFINGFDINEEWWEGGDMYIVVEGLTIQNAQRAAIRISCAHHVTIRNCILKDNGTWGIFTDYSDYSLLERNECRGSREEHGIYVSNSSDYPIIRENTVYDNAGCGIQINADPAMEEGDGITTGALVERNIIYRNGQNGGAAINLASVRDSIIRNNLIYNNYAGGIAGWGDGNGPAWGCKNNKIYNNTIYFASGEGRWAISLKEGSSGCNIRNNILCGGRRGAFEHSSDSLVGLSMDYNVLYSADLDSVVTNEDTDVWYALSEWQTASGQDSHSFTVGPEAIFVNHIKADFHLRTGSPCIDAGDPAPEYNDPDGTRNDMGAYGGSSQASMSTPVKKKGGEI